MTSQAEHPAPRPSGEAEASTARFGMGVFIVPFAILFVATLVLYVIVWLRLPEDVAAPGWPIWRMLLSTVVLIAVSVNLSKAVSAVRKGSTSARHFVLVALILGVLFLLSQLSVWLNVAPGWNPEAPDHFLYLFLLLTILHAAHVLGGLIPLVTITQATWRGFYTPTNTVGLSSIATYWHFLDVVWIVMLVVFLLTG